MNTNKLRPNEDLIDFQKESFDNKQISLSTTEIKKLSVEYRQLILNPKVTLEGETRIDRIMQLAVSNTKLATTLNEIDMNIAVSIGAISPQAAKTLASIES